MTEISRLGEFGLIEHLTKDIKIKTNLQSTAWETTAPYFIIRIPKCS